MILSLFCKWEFDLVNAFYTLFRVKELYRFENLWFQCYFPTLVLKFGNKLLEK